MVWDCTCPFEMAAEIIMGAPHLEGCPMRGVKLQPNSAAAAYLLGRLHALTFALLAAYDRDPKAIVHQVADVRAELERQAGELANVFR